MSEIILFFIFNSDTRLKTSGSLWQYCRDVSDDHDITGSESFKFKSKFTNNNSNKGTGNREIAVLLTYLSNFCITLEISLIIYEVNLILT